MQHMPAFTVGISGHMSLDPNDVDMVGECELMQSSEEISTWCAVRSSSKDRQSVEFVQSSPRMDEPSAIISIARLENNLAIRLSDVGRREEALKAAMEAAELYRQLAKANPDAFTPDLAMSLGDLGVTLEANNLQQKAVESFEEGHR